MLNYFYRQLAEILTPDVDISWQWEMKSRVLRKIGLKIGVGVAIGNGCDWLIGKELILHDYAAIGKNVRFYDFSGISVGKFAMIAGDVLIANGGHDKNTFIPFSGPILIGNGVWVGTGVKIVGANLTIGDNAIIGAGALVLKDVPSNAIVAGVPAKVIGYRTLPEKVWHFGNIWYSPYTFELID